MRLIALAVLSTLTLAACDQPAQPAPPPVDQPDAPVVLGGVDLAKPIRALGTEPFWGVDLTGTEMVYSGVDRPEQRAPQPKPVVQGTTATFTAQTTAGNPLIVTLVATQCSDGMSDRVYPLVAQVQIGEEKLTGCAIATADLAQAPAEGAPAQPAA